MNPNNQPGASNRQPENKQNTTKPQMLFNPNALGNLPNPTFPPNLPNLTPGVLTGSFNTPGLPGEQLGYPYMQDMNYQEHMKKLREKFVEMREQIDKMDKNPDLFKAHQLPLARVKKIMKSDEDVRMISAEAPVLFAKACEIFIVELTHRAWLHTEEGKRRTLQKNDIAQCIANTDIFDFLIDIIPREEYAKSAMLKKPSDSSYLNLGQYPNPPSMLGNIPIPPGMNYSLPPSMGVNLNSSLLNNNNMFAAANFKNPLVFSPNPKTATQNTMLNPNLLNYPMMNPNHQYGFANFDLPNNNSTGMPGTGSGPKGCIISKKEIDVRQTFFFSTQTLKIQSYPFIIYIGKEPLRE